MNSIALLTRLLDVIEHDLAPLSKSGVTTGNKIFGAAILRKSDLSLVAAEVNNEAENPLWHGEMHAIKRFYELPRQDRPAAKDCLFLATHEPCSLCLSGITWGGFDNFYYLFSYEETRDTFGIPHDIRVLREVFAVPDPDRAEAPPDRPLYNASNAFFESHDIARMIASLDRGNRESFTGRVGDLTALYAELSAAYQQGKGNKEIPFS